MTGKRKSLSVNRKPTKGKVADGNRRLPSYRDMIKTAIISQKQPRGSSRQSILNYICSNYNINDKEKANRYLKQALKTGIKTGFLNDATGKRTAEYFKLAEDTIKEQRRSTKQMKAIKKSNLFTPGSKPLNVCQKGVRTNSTKTRRAKRTKRTVKKRSSQPACKSKSKASQKLRNDTSAKPEKDKGEKGAASRMSSSPVCGTRKSGKKLSKSSTGLLPSDHLDSETPSQRHEIQSNSHEETHSGNSAIDLSYIQATLRETIILPLLTSPIKALAIATDGKKLILEVNTNTVRLYSPDLRKHLSCLKLKDNLIDIAVTGDNQAVITTGHLIYFIDFSSDFLSVMYTFFSTDYVVYGITACQEYIYDACQDGNVSVKMIDSSGNIYWSVSLDKMENERDRCFLGITSFDADGHVRLVVTDEEENTIKLLSGESGELLATYFTRNLDVSSPVTDIYNNVYVWYLASVVVKVLTSDLSAERSLAASKSYQRLPFQSGDNQRVPRHYFRRMAYDRNSNQLVLSVELGQLQIFQLNQK